MAEAVLSFILAFVCLLIVSLGETGLNLEIVLNLPVDLGRGRSHLGWGRATSLSSRKNGWKVVPS